MPLHLHLPLPPPTTPHPTPTSPRATTIYLPHLPTCLISHLGRLPRLLQCCFILTKLQWWHLFWTCGTLHDVQRTGVARCRLHAVWRSSRYVRCFRTGPCSLCNGTDILLGLTTFMVCCSLFSKTRVKKHSSLLPLRRPLRTVGVAVGRPVAAGPDHYRL